MTLAAAGPPKGFRILGDLLRTCRADVRTERVLLASATASIIAAAFFRVLEPWPLKFIYDFIFRHGHDHGRSFKFLGITLSAAGSQNRLLLVWLAVGGMVIFGGLAGAFDYLSNLAMGVTASRVLTKLRVRLFRHIQALDMGFHSGHKSGDLTAAVTADVDKLRDVTVSALLPFVSNTLVLFSMTGVMLWMNWRLGLLVLVAFPGFYFVVTSITARIQVVAREQRRRDGGIAAVASETIAAVKTIQAFGLEEEFVRRFSGDNRGSLLEGNKAQRLSSRLERTVDLFASVTTAGVLLLGANSVLDGHLTPGDLIVFVSYLRNSFKPIRQTAKYLAQIAKALSSGARVLSLLEECPAIRDSANSIAAPWFSGSIRFDSVSFAYRPGHPVLHDISFEVAPGERVAIVGPSGSGKSTLASMLLRFQDPQHGTVSIDGRDIRDYSITSLRSQIAVVMQDSVLFTGSIGENIGLGALGADEAAIRAAAAKAYAAEFIRQLPQQFATPVGERGATLSGGQRQRIAIARAHLRDSSILLLDEAATGLDTRNQVLVLKALRELSEGRTTLFITHDILAARDADRILFVCDGRLEEQGTHESLMRRGGGYAALCRQQFGNDDRENEFVAKGDVHAI
jgi:ATP-binding cassette subfamily B protein